MKIDILDLDFQGVPESIAVYLLEGPEGYALIETGPMSTLDTLHARLDERGIKPGEIREILVTHIHLDHAGAAGWWAQQGAQIYVHRIGAPHLIDPSKLWSSAGRIYGDQMEILWGEILPAPAERITALTDGDTVEVAGLQLTALNTPGHASHHHTYRLGDVAFTGDAAGVRVPQSQWVSLPAPPPEFNRELWLGTIARLEAEHFNVIYPTHFGRIEDVDNQFAQLRAMMDAATAFVKQQMDAGYERDEIVRMYVEWNREQAEAAGMPTASFDQYEAANPLFMSVDGIMRYWRKEEEARHSLA